MAPTRDIRPLLDPRSVAIVGASTAPHGWSARIWRNLQISGFPGKVYPINPKYDSLWDTRCYKDLDALPEVVDHAVFILPAKQIVEILRGMTVPKFRAGTILSGGFGEGGSAEGAERGRFLRAFAAEKGIGFCGPNCLGTVSSASRATVYPFPDDRTATIRPGSLSLISQSGGFINALVRATSSRGVGIRYAVASGSQLDLELCDYIDYFIQDEGTRVIAAYVEGIKDGRRLKDVARRALLAKKPVVLLKIGKSPASAAAAMAHTGSLAGDDAVFDAMCKESGIIRVDDLDELVNTTDAFLHTRVIPPGDGVAFVTISGGAKGLIVELAGSHGLRLPALSADTVQTLSQQAGVGTSVGNPLDIGWAGGANNSGYRDAVRSLLADPGIDLLAVHEDLPLDSDRADKEARLLAIAEIAAETTKPVFVFSMIAQHLTDYSVEFRKRCPLPVLQGAGHSIRALRHVGAFGVAATHPPTDEPLSSVTLPAAAEALLESSGSLNERDSYHVLASAGYPLAPWSVAPDLAAIERVTVDPARPVALKLIAKSLLHKTEVDGVRLNLRSHPELVAAARGMDGRFRATGGSPDGFLIQEMVTGGLETIIGTLNDPQYGPVVMFGLGGQLTELIREVVFRLAPISEADAERMVRSHRAYELLSGYRGKPRLDIAGLCAAISLTSRLASSYAAKIESIDLNPFIVLPDGCKLVDAAIVTRAATSAHPGQR